MTESTDWSRSRGFLFFPCPRKGFYRLHHEKDVRIRGVDFDFVCCREMLVKKTTYFQAHELDVHDNNTIVIDNIATNPSREVMEAFLQYAERRFKLSDFSTTKHCIPRPVPQGTSLDTYIDGVDKKYLEGLSRRTDQFVMDLWSLAACLEMNDLVELLGARFAVQNKIDELLKAPALLDLICGAYVPFAIRNVKEALALLKKGPGLLDIVADTTTYRGLFENVPFFERKGAASVFPDVVRIFWKTHSSEPSRPPTLQLVQPTQVHVKELEAQTKIIDDEKRNCRSVAGISDPGTSRIHLQILGLNNLEPRDIGCISGNCCFARTISELTLRDGFECVKGDVASYVCTLTNMYFLERLVLDDCPEVDNAWMETVCQSATCEIKSKLTHLTIRDCPKVSNEAMVFISEGLQRLQHLAIEGCGIDNAATEIIAKICTLRSLEIPTEIDGSAVGALSTIAGLAEITVPSIDGKSLRSLMTNNERQLQKLVVKDAATLSDEDVAESGILRHEHLKCLSLANCRATPNAFAGGSLPNLVQLVVGGCRFGDDSGVKFVASLKQLKHLAIFDASGLSVADLSLILSKNRQLVHLELHNVESIADVSSSPFTTSGHSCLQTLRIHFAGGVNDDIIDTVTCIRSVDELHITGEVNECTVTNYYRISDRLPNLRSLTLDLPDVVESIRVPHLKELTLNLPTNVSVHTNLLEKLTDLHALESIVLHNVASLKTIGLPDSKWETPSFSRTEKFSALKKVKLVATGRLRIPSTRALNHVLTTLSKSPLQEVGVHKFFDAAQAQEFAVLMAESNIPNVACCGIPSANAPVLKTCSGNVQWEKWKYVPCEDCS